MQAFGIPLLSCFFVPSPSPLPPPTQRIHGTIVLCFLVYLLRESEGGRGGEGEPRAEKAAPLRRASQVSTIIYAIYNF